MHDRAPLGPPPKLPLPGRSPPNAAPHSLQRAAEASSLLSAWLPGLAQQTPPCLQLSTYWLPGRGAQGLALS